MHEYRIEKLRLALSIRLLGGEVIDGHVFVQPGAFGRAQETALDLLNQPEPFLPIAPDAGGAGILLVAKSRIVEAWGDAVGEDDELRQATGRSARLELRLAGGASVEGSMLLEVRADRPRILDFLNENPQGFVRVNAATGPRGINVRLIEWARPLD